MCRADPPGQRPAGGAIVIEMQGSDVFRMDGEAGGHRVQRIPPTERRGRVHSSTITVAVLDPGASPEAPPLLRDADLKVEWFGGTVGAGGQHRNKHENACRLT